MAEAGADLLDIGGESTRPGHADVDPDEEARRVVPVVQAVREALPDMPLTVDTTKPAVAAAALDAGADAINDVWGVARDDALARIAGERGVPILLMHNRAEPRYTNLLPELLADLQRAIEPALRGGRRGGSGRASGCGPRRPDRDRRLPRHPRGRADGRGRPERRPHRDARRTNRRGRARCGYPHRRRRGASPQAGRRPGRAA